MVNGTLLNFGERYKDDLSVIFDQWPKLHLGLDALNNQKILNGVNTVAYLPELGKLGPQKANNPLCLDKLKT